MELIEAGLCPGPVPSATELVDGAEWDGDFTIPVFHPIHGREQVEKQEAGGDVAFGQTSANFDASQGKGAFKKYGKIGGIMNIALMSADHVHVVCTEASGIASWEDLPKSRFSAPGINSLSCSIHGLCPRWCAGCFKTHESYG